MGYAAPRLAGQVYFRLGLYLRSFQILGVICRLRRIQSSRYEIGLQMQGASVAEISYTSLVCVEWSSCVRQQLILLPVNTIF